MKNKMKQKKSSILKAKLEMAQVFEFLQERNQMLAEGFPYCYVENFIPMHCDTCIKFWRDRQKTHKGIDDKNILTTFK